jgi:stage II sporulation protein D
MLALAPLALLALLVWPWGRLPAQQRDDGRSVIRVVVGSTSAQARPGAHGSWMLRDAWHRVHAHGERDPDWLVERRNRRVRVVFPATGRVTAWSDEPFVLEPVRDGAVRWNGRRYRGQLAFVPVDTAILMVNVVRLEDYLRGVVPLELGIRSPNEQAALEAQAIAARSYAVVRARAGARAPFDLTAADWDQVYGGTEAEHPMADAAVAATAGQVLTYRGEVVQAPYHSACGGHTAAPSEAWSGVGESSWLRPVRDVPAGRDDPWCAIAPRYRWERTLDRRELEGAVARYVQARGGARLVAMGAVVGARIEGRTPSGRVSALLLDTDAGPLRLAGTALRTAFRSPRGEILYSTYFSLEPVIGRDGRLTQLTLHGTGNGHGVGMCQWGAIGRARAGHDARAILAAYYPGTVVAHLP